MPGSLRPMHVLVIGGTGPTGIPLVRGLVDRGHDVTILHRGMHERPETPAEVAHIHADPYDDDVAARRARPTSTFDVVVAMYGRLRMHRGGSTAGRVRPVRVGRRRARVPRAG